jgi:hypothetical protein
MDILERPVPEHKRFFRAASVIRQGRISPLSRFQLPKLLPKRVLSVPAPDFPPLFALGRFLRCDGISNGL